MKNIKSYFFVFVITLIICNKNDAQYSEFGVGIGFATYWGDLNAPKFTTNVANNSGLAFQLNYRRLFSSHLAFRGSLSIGRFKGSDENSTLDWQKLRNLSFKSSITELAILGEFYPFGFDNRPGSPTFIPYLTAGIGLFRFDPKTIYKGNEIRLQPLGTEGQSIQGYPNKYGLNGICIPFGGGMKFVITESISINADIILRKTFTDYIDDVSTYYVNYDELSAGNGTLAAKLGNRMGEYLGQSESDPVEIATGSVRGGPKVKDYYFMSIVSVNFMLTDMKGKKRFGGNKVVCPTFN